MHAPDDTLELDPELATLYARERATPLPDGATGRVLAGVLAVAATSAVSAGAAAAVAGKATVATGVSTKAAIAIAIASAIGGGAVAVVGYRAITPAPVVHESAPPAPAPAPTPDAAAPLVDAAIAPVLDATPDALVAEGAPPKPPREPAEDTREPLLVDRARTALRRGMIDEALATLMRHERIHPTGALAEERDVLIIEAYVAKRDVTLARRRIARYRAEYPGGFLRVRVEKSEVTLESLSESREPEPR